MESSDRESLRFNQLEHVLIKKVSELIQNMLQLPELTQTVADVLGEIRQRLFFSSDLALQGVTIPTKRREDFGDDAFGVEARASIEFFRLVMVEKSVGQHHRTEF